jgi:hypothetical protein
MSDETIQCDRCGEVLENTYCLCACQRETPTQGEIIKTQQATIEAQREQYEVMFRRMVRAGETIVRLEAENARFKGGWTAVDEANRWLNTEVNRLKAVIEDAGIEISESKEGMSWKRNDELKKQTGRVSR